MLCKLKPYLSFFLPLSFHHFCFCFLCRSLQHRYIRSDIFFCSLHIQYFRRDVFHFSLKVVCCEKKNTLEGELTPSAPTPQNGQTHSNNSSAIFVVLTFKGLKKKSTIYKMNHISPITSPFAYLFYFTEVYLEPCQISMMGVLWN